MSTCQNHTCNIIHEAGGSRPVWLNKISNIISKIHNSRGDSKMNRGVKTIKSLNLRKGYVF